jgi:peptide/nickel transport system substrate-binding protein
MLARKLPVLVLALGLAVAVVVSGASARTSAGGSGILRIGTTTYIDSFNPFNYIESQAFNAFVMVYPQLVQYTYGEQGFAIEGDWARSWTKSKDGKTWTFQLRPNTRWSDGQPMTANDAARRPCWPRRSAT